MSKNTGTPADHKITIEFLGTDVENELAFQLVYAVSCSCGELAGSQDAVTHNGANGRIRRHLERVGLMAESYTQR